MSDRTLYMTCSDGLLLMNINVVLSERTVDLSHSGKGN